MSDVEYREIRSATAFLLSIKRVAIRLMLISLLWLAILATLAWDALLIFGAGRLIGLWWGDRNKNPPVQHRRASLVADTVSGRLPDTRRMILGSR
jgi:hypothetical protein